MAVRTTQQVSLHSLLTFILRKKKGYSPMSARIGRTCAVGLQCRLRPRAVLITSRLVNKTYISVCFSLLRVHKTISRIDLLQRGIINANGSYIFKVIAQDHGFPRLSSEISVEINIVEAGDYSPVFNR